MTPRRDSTPGSLVSLGWPTSFALGLVTVVLGVIVALRPTQSLNVIAVLLGIAMIASGVYHATRALAGLEHERVWRGISGVLFILAGLALVRHLHLSLALIGLFIGFTWIVSGVAALLEGAAGHGRRGRDGSRGWSLFFGVVSLVAGIVVVTAPVRSVATLTVLLGAWLIVIGLLEMLGALVTRRASRPGQRPGAEERAGARAERS